MDIELDSEEFCHLGIKSAEQGRHEEALLYLKSAVAQGPTDAGAHYLLGAHYAQLGMVERAAAFMIKAVELKPDLVLARFQSGWLYMTMGQKDAAKKCWEPLQNLGERHPLQHFAIGLKALIDDDFAKCDHYLRQGISANQGVPALNADMARILGELQQRGLVALPQDAQHRDAPQPPASPANENQARPPYGAGLGAYQSQ